MLDNRRRVSNVSSSGNGSDLYTRTSELPRQQVSSPRLLPYVLGLQETFESIEAVPVSEASRILGVNRKTVYRWLSNRLELVPRKGAKWVSVRSIRAVLEANYGPTVTFNAFREVLEK